VPKSLIRNVVGFTATYFFHQPHKINRVMSKMKYFQKKMRDNWPTVTVQGGKTNPLSGWFTPQLINYKSNERLNWSAWVPSMTDDEFAFRDLLTMDKNFLLWKPTETKALPIDGKMTISKIGYEDPDMKDVSRYLMEEMYKPMFQDVEEEEADAPLLADAAEAELKLKDAATVYVLYSNKRIAAIAVLSHMSSLESGFRTVGEGRKRIQDALRNRGLQSAVYLDVIFTVDKTIRGLGSILLQKIENDHPQSLLIALSVPSRNTLYFYKNRGFSYGDMSKYNSTNYLPTISKYLDLGMMLWNQGNPRLTLMYPDTVGRHVLISFVYADDWDRHTAADVILFAGDQNAALNSEDYEDVIEKTASGNLSERMIFTAPESPMTKGEYTARVESMIRLAERILASGRAQEVMILTQNRPWRRYLLQTTAAKLWGAYVQPSSPPSSPTQSMPSANPSPNASPIPDGAGADEEEDDDEDDDEDEYLVEDDEEDEEDEEGPEEYSEIADEPDDELDLSYFYKVTKEGEEEDFDLNKLKELIRYYFIRRQLMIQNYSHRDFAARYEEFGFTHPPPDRACCLRLTNMDTGRLVSMISYTRSFNTVQILDLRHGPILDEASIFIFYLRVRHGRVTLQVADGVLAEADDELFDMDLEDLLVHAFTPYHIRRFFGVCNSKSQGRMCARSSEPTVVSKKRSM
jgi:hypothetical protein